ncbi:hypothetical protein [Kaistella sp.]
MLYFVANTEIPASLIVCSKNNKLENVFAKVALDELITTKVKKNIGEI